MKSIVLNHCFVCGGLFNDSGGTLVKHFHHMVPVAYGGVDGPQVTLCSEDHNTLHHIAVAMKSGKTYHKYLYQKTPEVCKKLKTLATIVYNSELASRNDPNKLVSVMLHLNAEQKQKIEMLKKVYPKTSRSELFFLAIENLYLKHFKG
jgi:hypothetical protein